VPGTGDVPGTSIFRVCPNFVGYGRFVGQLLAVVLQSWDTPFSDLIDKPEEIWHNKHNF